MKPCRPPRTEPLLFEAGRPGRSGWSMPRLAVPEPPDDLEPELRRSEPPPLPELSETEVLRHFARLSHRNYSIDDGLLPLGSCTMKYNPRVNEQLARLPGFAAIHPLQPEETVQGALALMRDLERFLVEISGMDAFTLVPAAGAHGELTGMLMIRRALLHRGDDRRVVLIPDSAHGTNPASAAFCGFTPEPIASDERGQVDLAALEARVPRGDVAAIMLTNPNTLGIFESDIARICELLHAHGGFVYADGANMNALLGISRPGDHGVDVLHLNLHKTFSTPHGGGGPGSGPVGVRGELVDFLPVPRVVEGEDGLLHLSTDFPRSIGRVAAFYGNFGVMVRAAAYILEMGPEGLRRAGEDAILAANYVRKGLEDVLELSYETPTLHEVVFSGRRLEKETGCRTLDLAKRLIDHGFHPPTIYFPLIVPGALMIEPTETESREELDAFVAAIRAVVEEAHRDPETVKGAPWTAPVRRLDEVKANRQLVLRWEPSAD